MENIFNLTIQCDNNLILAIIAINMTVIGLTSLAESKSIIGIDYGKFLVKKYKVFNFVKMYHLLIVFAAINIISILCLFIRNDRLIKWIFIILVLSLIFSIYYFFAYIMIENSHVKKQIYMQELMGLYYSSDKKTTFEVDELVNISNGSSTSKKISGDIIAYFNNFSSESQKYFCEVFGPESIIYKNISNTNPNIKSKIDAKPYEYRQGNDGVWDISHEFFQMFRYTELQDKWAIDILRIINKDDCVHRKYEIIRLYNVTRVITHINTFGYNEEIYKYKFLEHFKYYFYNAVKISDEEIKLMSSDEKNHIISVEEYAIEQLVKYIINTIVTYNDFNFIHYSKKVLNKIAFKDCSEASKMLDLEKRFKIFLKRVVKADNKQVKEIFVELLNEYSSKDTNKPIPEFMELKAIKKYINDFNKNEDLTSKISVDDLFK